MKIEATRFGSITIDGQTYEHDVVIRLSGEVIKRQKKLSKKYYGTSHTLSQEEAEFIYEDGGKELILGTGQYDSVRLSEEAKDFFDRQGCKVVMAATPNALNLFNRSVAGKIGLFHVTC